MEHVHVTRRQVVNEDKALEGLSEMEILRLKKSEKEYQRSVAGVLPAGKRGLG